LSWFDRDRYSVGPPNEITISSEIELQPQTALAPTEYPSSTKNTRSQHQTSYSDRQVDAFREWNLRGSVYKPLLPSNTVLRHRSPSSLQVQLAQRLLNDYELSAIFSISKDYRMLFDVLVVDHPRDLYAFYTTTKQTSLTKEPLSLALVCDLYIPTIFSCLRWEYSGDDRDLYYIT
jgi:hypothetical protein